jgi:hypothetical protein
MKMRLEQVQVRIEPELRKKLQAKADAELRPLAGLIRVILRDAIITPPAANQQGAGAQ